MRESVVTNNEKRELTVDDLKDVSGGGYTITVYAWPSSPFISAGGTQPQHAPLKS